MIIVWIIKVSLATRFFPSPPPPPPPLAFHWMEIGLAVDCRVCPVGPEESGEERKYDGLSSGSTAGEFWGLGKCFSLICLKFRPHLTLGRTNLRRCGVCSTLDDSARRIGRTVFLLSSLPFRTGLFAWSPAPLTRLDCATYSEHSRLQPTATCTQARPSRQVRRP